LLRIGSITKAFTGAVLASLVADGKVKLTDTLAQRLGWDVVVPMREGRQIRLIDLAAHTSGLPREIERTPGPDDNPFATITKEAFINNLQSDPLLFAPGRGALYSNFGFDLLAQALANSAGTSYPTLLQERVLKPAGLTSTSFTPDRRQQQQMMQGHDFSGTPLPDVPSVPMIVDRAGSTPRPKTSCAGSPGISIVLPARRPRCASSITQPMSIATVSTRSLVSTNPAVPMQSALAGSS
jgi:D-alanyl-D-alanine-carboxypeptidase/D-alanyl-D-alanine-endopeptidase